MAYGASSAHCSRDVDVREARRQLRDAYVEDERSDAAARTVLCVFGAPVQLHHDPLVASGHNLGRELVPLPGQHVSAQRPSPQRCTFDLLAPGFPAPSDKLASAHIRAHALLPQHARVSRFDVRLTMLGEELAAASSPDSNLEQVVQDSRSSRRPGTNRYPFDPPSMRFRDMLNWERFRDAIVSNA